ncbi:uncharacterized sporulation protein YeaH/YhbH (DUF444 family) [Caldalkalibacillus uzonensis]|uniref:Uncharacterized sporulation protein YeaH/YhbH (DUF444 family) n=1 Tax=Caldalkalibacillus uzonensis TaxID=353224 RepID=A0ABU0CV33_9BACI|nr:uncharacterized sporulation protein YeaH/YhbH (DUF444 family) [Caldalkalibacillus uzonensis]
MVGYGEIQTYPKSNSLLTRFQKLENKSFICRKMQRKEDVYPTLKAFFSNSIDERGLA